MENHMQSLHLSLAVKHANYEKNPKACEMNSIKFYNKKYKGLSRGVFTKKGAGYKW